MRNCKISKLASNYARPLRLQHGCNFISAMPTNMYGPNDNYDLQTSHVLPALIRKFHDAKLSRAPAVTCWGTGTPLREFLYADDLAAACLFLLENYNEEQFINVGSGSEISIRDLAELTMKIVGYQGDLIWDKTKPDGTPRKLMDSSRLFALGWKPKIDLSSGIRMAYEDFLKKAAA